MKKLVLLSVFILTVCFTYGQKLQKDGVVCIHTLTVNLNQDVSMSQYLAVLEDKLIPVYEKLAECKIFITKGLNRETEGQYGMIYVYKSKDVFNTYWQDDGSPTEKGDDVIKKLQPAIDELNQLGTLNVIVNDWAIK
ncbi:hypothetical protein ACE1ET_15530 [Saccharicrinis sp. FJH62]|uniref:hypothetical protein n=1 Tax=Saccharicrinis sp. FJH62 TaxID=3344657 RepID=UPI0035D4F210